MKIVVLGDSGLLGQALLKTWGHDHAIRGIARQDFSAPAHWDMQDYAHWCADLTTQDESLLVQVRAFAPDVIVNCVALTNLNSCEADPEAAMALNATLVGIWASIANRLAARFVHISTDQVFDGTSHVPYTESDTTNPTHVYGRTKRAGEHAALGNHPEALVLRTNIVGFRRRGAGAVFAEWLYDALVNAEAIKLFDDYVTNSLHVNLLAHLIMSALEKSLTGLYHAVSQDPASKYALGEALAQAAGLSMAQVTKSSVQAVEFVPPRPPYLALSTEKLATALGYPMPDFQATVHALAADIKAEQAQKEAACV